ncbi:kinase-like domain-containing protein [Helicostylum pulchrum]|nr:kinase-like domain-containing protein [Helicostylum pulchrum]
MNTVYDIKVTECPIVVKDSNDESWKTVPEFNITVKTSQYTLYVIRYIPDLLSFNHLVKTHYQKIKIPFPTLTESLTKLEKRKSIRNFFHMQTKSNAEKVEKYLYRCSMDIILKDSSLLRDFFSPQREGDTQTHDNQLYPSPSPSYDSLRPTSNDSETSIGKWVPKSSSQEDLIDMIKKEAQIPLAYQFPLDHLEMIKVLGKGCMGKELYALKSIVKEHVIEQREITHTLDERNILTKLSELDHPYLAKLHTSFQDEHRLYLLTNYYCGGDLATHMAKLYCFPKECALFYAAEMIDGISELHRLGILYRDLKPENILLTGDGHIILTDFGLSKWLDANDDFSTQTFCGTAEYLAPEVLLGESYSFGIDHWSFGTILRVLEDPLEFPADIFDYETAEFLSDILDRDPRTRLGAHSIDDIKDHVYFADISWDDIRSRKLQPPYLPPVSADPTQELDFTNFDPDFLAMTPQLTPISSQIDFSQVQDIFDGYSFTDQQYLAYEHEEEEERTYSRQSYREDGFYDEPLLFQPARKRGSVSMLSNVDSFCLDNNNHTLLNKEDVTAKDEELARYAKRRNTSASEDHQQQPVQQQSNNTLVVSNPIPDTFDDLEFSTLPDLRLSFNMDRDSVPKIPASNKSSHQSKTRRFFSLLL